MSEILTIANLRHAASRIWTCAEPEFSLSWMKLCSSDNHFKISRRKAAVRKWNLIKHGKSNYTNLLWQISGIKNEDEYSLQCVKQLAAYMNERENLFDWREILIKNLKTGATFKEKSSYFILNRFSEWKVAYEKFRKERLEINKSTKLFDTILKSRSSFKKGKPWKTPDKKEEMINFSVTGRLCEASRVWCRVSNDKRKRGFFISFEKRWRIPKIPKIRIC